MDNGYFNSKNSRILGSVALVALIVALASYAVLNLEMAKNVEKMEATISVTGEGEILAIPDIGTFTFSVNAQAATAPEAQQLSGTKINEILAYLKEQGIEEKDIKTENYNLFPRYRYEEKVCQFGSFCPPGEQIPDGFEVTQSVVVKVRDTAKAGNLIAGVGERGATDIGGLSFTIDDADALKVDAREKAITDAKAKADVLAAQLGVKITRLVSYSENSDEYMPYVKTMEMSADAASAFGGAELPVGEESTKVRVQVTYEVE